MIGRVILSALAWGLAGGALVLATSPVWVGLLP